jgi:hypothetical protein
MANKTSEQQQQEAGAKPFFAHLLSSQRDPAAAAPSDGPAPTYNCLDSECTKKYPSDDDESTTWFNDRDS